MEMMITCYLSSVLMLLLSNNVKLITSTTVLNLTTDQSALLALKKFITLHSHSVVINNWTANTPTCSWIGVSCAAKHRRVTALNISGYQLRGTIPPDLGNLTFLQSLDISSNNLTGVIPSELSKLRRLEEMNMGFNNLAGEIPSELGALPRLQSINLCNNSLSGTIPNAIFNISSIMEIDVSFNKLSGKLPDDICSYTPKLKNMSLAGNQFYGEIPANISKCREMEGLRLGWNKFYCSIPSEIGSLRMLKYLSLLDNKFTGSIPSSVFNISSLIYMVLIDNQLSGTIPTDTPYNLLQIEAISLSGNYLTGGIPRQFGNLSSLWWLECARNSLSGELPEEVGNLAKLESFAAPYNKLSGHIHSSIFNLSRLTQFWAQQNLLSGSIPSDMGLSFFSLKNLVLSFNRLTGEIPAALTNATQLIILELNLNSLTGPIPDFGNLRQLQVLRLWKNNLTGAESPTQELEFISSLTNCQDLRVLEILYNPFLTGVLPASTGNLSDSLYRIWAQYCNINGGIPSEIGNLNSLQSLQLSGNKLTGFIPKTLANLEQLQLLKLGENQLQGYIPRDLCRLSNLGELNLSLNGFTGPIDECFGGLGFLRILSFASNNLNSTIPSKLWDLSDLVTLDLSSNRLSGEVSPQIGKWKINQLDLSSNQFTGDIPSLIGDCKSLVYLSLSNNKFGGSIPDTLGGLGGLTTLNLSNNELSGLIPKSLEGLRFLEDFDLSYNRLEGEIPDGIPNSTAQSFVHNSALCGASRFQVRSCRHGRSRSKTIALIFLKYVLPSFAAAAFLVAVVVLLVRRSKKGVTPPATDKISLEKLARRRISETEIVQGTTSFSETNLLGMGSFGKVYKATLSDGLNYAVKVFNSQLEGAIKSFAIESEILSSIRHRNLLPVISCCSNINTEFRALILEYMPNGSLDKWLHSDGYSLDLMQRLRIATDVALALEYLHHGHTFPIVHCDIKPSNVLLDKDMTAHVGDFGISKLFRQGEAITHTTTLATIGYAAPEFGSEGKVSTNGDVYSYGILLLEIFTRKKPTDEMFSEEMSLKDWVKAAVEEDAIVSKVVAPGLVLGEDQHASAKEQCLSSVFDTAMECLTFSPDQRLNMIQVVAALHKIKAKIITSTSHSQ